MRSVRGWHAACRRHIVFFPGRTDQMHALDTFDGLHHVNCAEIRPPTIARLLHESETVQPFLGRERRRIATEMAAIDFHIEQLQPILQARQADEFSVLRQEVGAGQAPCNLAQAP